MLVRVGGGGVNASSSSYPIMLSLLLLSSKRPDGRLAKVAARNTVCIFYKLQQCKWEVEDVPPPTTTSLRRRPCLVGVLAVCYKLPHSNGAHIK